MKFKHTPGPWRACQNGECPCGMIWSVKVDIPVAAHTHMNILSSCEKDEGYNLGQGIDNQSEEFKANVKLVAKAPELLKALINSTKELNRIKHDGSHDVLNTLLPVENEKLIKETTGMTIKEILEDEKCNAPLEK